MIHKSGLKCPSCDFKAKKKIAVIGHYRFAHGGGKGKLADELIRKG